VATKKPHRREVIECTRSSEKVWVNLEHLLCTSLVIIYSRKVETVYNMTAALFNDGHQVIEYRFRHGNRSYRWLRDEARLLRDDDRVPLEIVGSCVDITEEKEIQNALCESEEKFRALAEFYQRGAAARARRAQGGRTGAA